ncbi:10918_t:CDS:2, partial [Acaulospora morrowiae]
MSPRRSSDLDLSPPSPLRTPTPPGQSPTGGVLNKRKKSREEKDSIFSFFWSSSRPASPSHDSSLHSLNNITSRSSKREGRHIRKLSAGNLKSVLSLPDGDEPRRKSFDSVQPDMNVRYGYVAPPDPNIVPFAYQSLDLPFETDNDSLPKTNPGGPNKEEKKKNIFPKWFRKGSKDKDTALYEGLFVRSELFINRKNSDFDSYSFPNLIVTPTHEKDDPFLATLNSNSRAPSLTGKSDHHWVKVNLKKEKSWKKK